MSYYDENMMVAQCACGAIMPSDQFMCEECACRKRGCMLPVRHPHYHCAHCDSADVTSMMGHYRSDDAVTWYFTCDKETKC
ncbi:hypothetical protein HWB05_gp119 [Streptomyces phage BRock]|uniref:Uncharacterized protein n=1 Tax=Streptomyces phage BRock TaxID=1913591 RepID=A0A1J0GW26_9CAUD|nr:hypothetical protein HWB05_gp119 [Streptomyces phage BRock]APC46381.1 hypothetical protein [Streptomyces phage BRock]